jgi:hypothetical protein
MNSLILLKNLKQLAKHSHCVKNFKLKHAFFSDLPNKAQVSSDLKSNNHNALSNRKYRESYECVYEFRHIKSLRLLTRFKVYQTFFSIAFAGYSFFAIDDLNILLLTNGTMLLAVVMLFIISRQAVRVVGRMYISDDKTKALISHLDFYGKRRDFEVEISEIEPLASFDELKEAYVHLRLKDATGSMVVSLPYGRVHDKKALLKILGAE